MGSIKLNRFLGLALGAAGLLGIAAPRVAFANDSDKKFSEMDTNGDGRVSPDEYTSWTSHMFDKADTNKDGKVTAAELTAAHQKMAGKTGEKGGQIAADKVKKFDTNGDGALSSDEQAAGARTMFDKLDTDHDGYLTKAELKAGHEKMMQKATTSK